jgi:hypothetical protein
MVNDLENAFDSFPELLSIFFFFKIEDIVGFIDRGKKLNKSITRRSNSDIILVDDFSIKSIYFNSDIWFRVEIFIILI